MGLSPCWLLCRIFFALFSEHNSPRSAGRIHFPRNTFLAQGSIFRIRCTQSWKVREYGCEKLLLFYNKTIDSRVVCSFLRQHMTRRRQEIRRLVRGKISLERWSTLFWGEASLSPQTPRTQHTRNTESLYPWSKSHTQFCRNICLWSHRQTRACTALRRRRRKTRSGAGLCDWLVWSASSSRELPRRVMWDHGRGGWLGPGQSLSRLGRISSSEISPDSAHSCLKLIYNSDLQQIWKTTK